MDHDLCSVILVFMQPTNMLLRNDKKSLILTDLGSATVARTTISSRQEAIAIQERCAETCTAPYRSCDLL